MAGRLVNEIRYYCQPFKPRLAWELLKASVTRDWRHLALTVDVALGYGCNMKCRHCSAATLQSPDAAALDHNDCAKLGEQFDRMRVIRINLTGGEPLLRPDFDRLLRALRPERRHVKLQTNGALLDRPRIRALKSAGVNAISISLDTLDPDEYADFRGVSRDCHATVLRNLEVARQVGLQVSTSFVLTHHNLRSESVRAVIEFTAKRRLILLANIATVSGRWQARPDYLFDGQDRRYLNELLRSNPHVRTDHDLTGCPAAVRKLYITAYGDVLPCPFIHVSFGNVRREPLAVIQARMKRNYPFSGSEVCPAAEDKRYFQQWHQAISQAATVPMDYRALPEDARS